MKKVNKYIKDCCIVTAGGDKPKVFSEEKTEENTIPVYANGIENDGLVGFTNVAKVTKNAITISARGTTGAVFYRNKPYVPIVRLISVIPNQNVIDDKYLYCVLLNSGIKGIGSVQSQLTIPDIEMSKISIFEDIEYQKKISNLIFSIIEQIERNNAMVQKLPTYNSTTYRRSQWKGELKYVA